MPQTAPSSREKSRRASTIFDSISTCGVGESTALASATASSTTDGMSLRMSVLVRLSTLTVPRAVRSFFTIASTSVALP